MKKNCAGLKPKDQGNGLTKLVVSLPPDKICQLPGGKLPPLYLRTSFYDEDSPGRDADKVYLPVDGFGDVNTQLLCIYYGGIPVIHDEGHFYVQASWLLEEHPNMADNIQVVVHRVAELAVDKAA